MFFPPLIQIIAFGYPGQRRKAHGDGGLNEPDNREPAVGGEVREHPDFRVVGEVQSVDELSAAIRE
jgi:hypothetical protein